MTIAVFGARPQSLGAGVARALRDADFSVETIGPTSEDRRWSAGERMDLSPYSDVVMTIGVNHPDSFDLDGRMQMDVNYFAPMELARQWKASAALLAASASSLASGHFVVISSNSAHIPRSNSAGYCASKAALSMGIRSLSRTVVRGAGVFYGWEFGLLRGTPMTAQVAARLGSSVPLSRIPGAVDGLSVAACAGLVVAGLTTGGWELNGCMLRVDGGEC